MKEKLGGIKGRLRCREAWDEGKVGLKGRFYFSDVTLVSDDNYR